MNWLKEKRLKDDEIRRNRSAMSKYRMSRSRVPGNSSVDGGIAPLDARQ
jgi:hypothetical protein